MTITLGLLSGQEHRLCASAACQDAEAVYEILLQAVDATVDGLLHTSVRWPRSAVLSALLDQIAAEQCDAPALADEAVSRAGSYAEHP